MIPPPDDNIYSKTKENLQALFSHYFDKFDMQHGTAVEKMMEKKSLKLNQVEYIVRVTSECWEEVLSKHFGTNDLGNILRHTMEGLTRPEEDWRFPPTGKSIPIVREFLTYLRDNIGSSPGKFHQRTSFGKYTITIQEKV